MSNAPTGARWALQLHAAMDWLFWVLQMNVLWYLFTLAGGVLFGVAPAAVAATELTRQRLRGDKFPVLRSFASIWRREFVRANAVALPSLIVTGLLAVSTASALASNALGTPVGIVTAVALAAAVGHTAVVVPLYVNYELPLSSYAFTAARWALGNLPHVALLLLAVVAVTGISAAVPGVIPFLSVGALLVIVTALCLGFFDANEKRLAEASAALP